MFFVETDNVESVINEVIEDIEQSDYNKQLQINKVLAIEGGYLRKYFAKYYSLTYDEIEYKYEDFKHRFQCAIAVMMNTISLKDIENIFKEYVKQKLTIQPIDYINNIVSENVCKLFSLTEIVLELKYRCISIRDVVINETPFELLLTTAYNILTSKILQPTHEQMIRKYLCLWFAQ